MYGTAKAFYDSPAKPLLFPLQKEGSNLEFILSVLIPQLSTFRTFVYMHDIDRKIKKDLEEEEKLRLEEEEKRRLEAEQRKEEENEEEEKAEEAEEKKEDKKEEVEELTEEELAAKVAEEKRLKQEAEDAKYGRYYLWEDLIPEQKYSLWKNVADKIDGVNPHLVEDIQDYIVTKSFRADTPQGKKELEETKKSLAEQQTAVLTGGVEEEKKLTKVDIRLGVYRPHKRIWNYFLEKDSPYFREHRFR
eukprot:TRINITY_DN7963_c0_g1_i3.p2 TRINITY_DN7963_c0_g1~~TRINITY_DN7963_c0_g1_i3.p2  ORF type:complete len:247 (+),score=117.06 TRINITY_DN7963_c0_g1_i3:1209-1949(+)